MRILVVGAGAIGGYFGGRLLQAGRDVTFLVRPRRAAELADAGLVIKSPNGDVTLKNPPAVQADKLSEKFDVVLLSCKAFDLYDAIESLRRRWDRRPRSSRCSTACCISTCSTASSGASARLAASVRSR